MKFKFMVGLIAVGLALGLYRVGAESLKENLQKKLSKSIGQPVTIRGAYPLFPPALFLSGLEVGKPFDPMEKPILSVAQLSIRVNFLKFLQGQWGVEMELANPKLFFTRDSQGVFNEAFLSLIKRRPVFPRSAVFLHRVRARDGEIVFIDRRVSPETKWTVRNVSLSAGLDPKKKGYRFSLLALLDGAQPSATLEFGGEMVLDETGKIKMALTDWPAQKFAPYLRDILGVAPSQGICTIESVLILHKKMLTSSTTLVGRGLLFPGAEQTVFGLPGNKLIELLKDKEGNVHLKFDVGGSLNDSTDWPSLIQEAFGESIHQAMTANLQNLLSDVEKKPVVDVIQNEGESLSR